MKKRRKKNTGGLILLLLLFVLLAVMLVLRFLAVGSEAPSQAVPSENETVTPAENTPDLSNAENPESVDKAVQTPAPTLAPVQETAPPPVVLENEGEIEIIIPDEMDQDGF